jgi:hypothetical protein
MGRDSASSAQSKHVGTELDRGSMRGRGCITVTAGVTVGGDGAAGDVGRVYQIDNAKTVC